MLIDLISCFFHGKKTSIIQGERIITSHVQLGGVAFVKCLSIDPAFFFKAIFISNIFLDFLKEREDQELFYPVESNFPLGNFELLYWSLGPLL